MLMRLVATLLAATTPAAAFKLPWSRSAAPKSGGYQELKRGEDPVQRVLYEHSLTYQGLSYNKQD